MRFSETWLREWIDIPVTTAELTEKLSLAGLEVEAVLPAAGAFTQVVTAKILNTKPHPNASKLQICEVQINKTETQTIVCGASNARPGLSVAAALIGAVLPGGLEIKRAQLRGVDSFGMLCSASELGLAETSNGILELAEDVPLGLSLIDYLNLHDTIIELNVTPNRGDCLSVLGVAREVSALYNIPIQFTLPKAIKGNTQLDFPVQVEASLRCPRYIGRVISGINPNAKSPVWLKERLRRSGLKSIHPVVDVTNYVMLALGQPLHAFDFNTVHKKIVVRHAKKGESLTLLDGNTVELLTGDLVIADEKQPIALSGIMGGHATAVKEDTTEIFLESAYFTGKPLSVSARTHKLQSDSLYRFERGVDPALSPQAIEMATALILEITGGEAGAVIEVCDKGSIPINAPIALKSEEVVNLLGFQVDKSFIQSSLKALGFTVTADQTAEDSYLITAPSYRFDIGCKADLIEEIARVYGYDKIPAVLPQAELKAHSIPTGYIPTLRFAKLLADRGYHEVITYSFISPSLQAILFPEEKTLTLANPISSDMSVMRTSLWPGLLQTLQYNQRHQQARIRLFETGLCFITSKTGQLEQTPMLAGAVVGTTYPEVWHNDKRASDFYDIKGDLEALDALTGNREPLYCLPSTAKVLHPGQSADLYRGKERLGSFGALHPEKVKQLKFDKIPFLFELSLSILAKALPAHFNGVSKFPSIRRDIALLVDKAVSFEQIRQKVLENSGDLLKNIHVFDEYIGKGVPQGQKSIAIALYFQHAERTLIDDEVVTLVENIIDSLVKVFNISLRK